MPISAYTGGISNYTNTQDYQRNQVNESLTSGKKINNAADNPSGMAIITAMATDLMSMDTGSRNTLSGISLMQTADGAASSLNDNLMRMRELSLQAQNGTLNDSQRAMIDQEFQQLYQGMNQISQSTQFNGQNIMNGEMTSMNIQIGESSMELGLADLSNNTLAMNGLSLGNASSATSAMSAIDGALEMVTAARGQYGAYQNRMQSAYDNLQNQSVATAESRSQINDTNFAPSGF